MPYHRRSIRLPGFDYSQNGYYFVTICTHNRDYLFGQIENGAMKLNNIGKIVQRQWLQTPNIRKYIGLDIFVVMPNHFHAVVIINNIITNHVGAYCNTPLPNMPQYIYTHQKEGVFPLFLLTKYPISYCTQITQLLSKVAGV